MSDIFFSAGFHVEINQVIAQLSWTKLTKGWHKQSFGLTLVSTRLDDEKHWSPAYDPNSNLYAVVAGRFAFNESEWLASEHLPFKGGLAARLVLDGWLNKGGSRAIERLNGAGVAIILDEKNRKIHLWTDRMGTYPLYYSSARGFLVSSNADVAANFLAQAGKSCKFDAVTMAEFLRTGTATQPHTYWIGIEQLEAGTHYQFCWGDGARLTRKCKYWSPAYLKNTYLNDRVEIVERLTDALSSSVRMRTLPRLGKVVVMLSSGADSRVALFGACEPEKVTAITFYDEPNKELEGAQALAKLSGATHVSYQRSKDYYFENAEKAVRVSGGMWSIDSAHYGGVISQLLEEKPGIVLTGCYADYLLKGLSFNRVERKFLGRTLPLYKLSTFSYEWYQKFYEITPFWQNVVDKRQEVRYSIIGLSEEKRQSSAEYLRLSPIVREADAVGRHTLRCMTPYDFFVADNEVIELSGLISPLEKLNGIAFGMAVSNITRNIDHLILNNNYSAPVGANELERILGFMKNSLKRKLSGNIGLHPFQRNPESVGTAGSWPYFPAVIKKSERLHDWFSNQSITQRNFIFEILGNERRSWSINEWADREVSLFLRYYTASIWLDQHPELM